MFFMKSLCRVIIVFLMLSLSFCLFGGEEDHPYDREMKWFKNKDVSEHSKYAVPEYNAIKQDIVNYFLFDVTDDRDMDFKDKVTNDFWLNSNFYGYSEEQAYYLSDDETDDEGNFNWGDYITGEDYSCIKNINVSRGFRYNNAAQKFYWHSYLNDFYAILDLNVYLKLILNSNFNNQKKIEDNYYKEIHSIWTKEGCVIRVPKRDYNYLKVDYSNNNYVNLDIIKYPYISLSDNTFEINYDWDDDTKYGKWWLKEDDYLPYLKWADKNEKIKYYYSKSPRPYIMGEKIFTKHFDATEDTITYNNKIYDTEIKTDYNVKVLYARFYKYNEIEKKWKYNNEENPDIVRIMSRFEDGIDKIKISEEDGKRFQNDGKYMMILSCIDKFNKIFLFEPEYFIIDKAAPKVSGVIVPEESFFTATTGNPMIADFREVAFEEDGVNLKEARDNGKLDQYIYIKEKYVTEPYKLSDTINNTKFIFEENQIKILKENEYIYVEKIYIQDLAGNESDSLIEIEGRQYAWDRTAPVAVPSSLNSEYLTSKQNLYFNIEEAFGVKTESVNVNVELIESPGVTSTKKYYYPSRNDDLLVVDLKAFEGMEGTLKVTLELTDLAGNERRYYQDYFTFKYDDREPGVTVTLNDDPLYNYYNKALNVDGRFNIISTDTNFDKAVIFFITNNFRDNITLTQNDAEYILSKMDGINEELITIKIYDKAGNYAEIENINIIFSDDHEPPVFINAFRDIENEWRYDLEAADAGSYIKNVYFKEIITDADEVIISDFGNITDPGCIIASDVKIYKTEIDILPGRAVCFILEDAWGNMSEGLILRNKQSEYYEIHTEQDLINTNWDLSGDVIIYDNDIIVGSDDVLKIRSKVYGPTRIRFAEKTDGSKIKIINNGQIEIYHNDNNVIFTGLNEDENGYSWFGIINESGELTVSGKNKVIFKNAVSPIVFNNPGISPGTLSKLEFDSCKMGIHFIDDGTNYQSLTINNISFIDMIYGIKFDLNNINNKGSYTNALDYLTADSITKNNIIRADIYCPVDGLKEFSNYNIAPEAFNVVIESLDGEFKVLKTLRILYEYRDDGTVLEESTEYQWYASNNMQGPYSPIEDASDDMWDVPLGYGGKWIKARVIVQDNDLGVSSPSYSDAVQIGNNPPSAENALIIVEPDRVNEINYQDRLTAAFDYKDDEDIPEYNGINHIYKWYISDTENYDDSLEVKAAGISWVPAQDEYADKYVYFTVQPVDSAGVKGQTAYSNFRKIADLGIPEIIGDIVLEEKEIDGQDVLVGEFDFRLVNINDSTSDFIYEWRKVDKEGTETPLEGIKNELPIIRGVNGFEGHEIILRVTPVNSVGVAGLYKDSAAYDIPFSPPIITSFEIECKREGGFTTDGEGDAVLPRPGNYLEIKADVEDPNGLTAWCEYKWYVSEGNNYVLLSTDRTLDLTDEHLEKTIEVRITPVNIEGVSGDRTDDTIKTCQIKSLNLTVEKEINNKTIKFENGIGNFYYNTTDNVTQHSYSFRLNDLLDLTKEEYKDVTATIKVQGAGGGGGGGCDSIFGVNYISDVDSRVAGGGGGGGSAGEYKEIEDVSLSITDVITIKVGKGGDGGLRRKSNKIADDYPTYGNGKKGNESSVSGVDIYNEPIPISSEGGNGGTSGSLKFTVANIPYQGLRVSGRSLIHGKGGISISGVEAHNGKDAHDPDLGNIRNGGTGGNGGSITGENIKGGYCRIHSNGTAHDGTPGENAEINSGNGGGGGGGAGCHGSTSSGDGTHNGGNGGSGGNGYVIIELSGEMYTTDWE